MKLSDYSDQRTEILDKIINTLGKDYKAFENNSERTCSKMLAIAESLKKIDDKLAEKTCKAIQTAAESSSEDSEYVPWYYASEFATVINKHKNEILVQNLVKEIKNLNDADIKKKLTELSGDDQIKFVKGLLNSMTADRSNESYETTQKLLSMFNLRLKHEEYKELPFDQRRARRAAFMGSLNGGDENAYSEIYKRHLTIQKLKEDMEESWNIDERYMQRLRADKNRYETWVDYAKKNKSWYLELVLSNDDVFDKNITSKKEVSAYKKTSNILYEISFSQYKDEKEHLELAEKLKKEYTNLEKKYGKETTLEVLKLIATQRQKDYLAAVNSDILPKIENGEQITDNNHRYDFSQWSVIKAAREENLNIDENKVAEALNQQNILPEDAYQMNFADFSNIMVEKYGNRYGFVGLQNIQKEDETQEKLDLDYVPSTGYRNDFWRSIAENKELKKFMAQDWLAHGVKQEYIDAIFDGMEWRGNPRFRGWNEVEDILPQLDLDHINPLHKGGKNDYSNFRIICSFGKTDLHRDIFHQTDDPSIKLYYNQENDNQPASKRYQEKDSIEDGRIYESVELIPDNVVYMSGLSPKNMFVQQRDRFQFIGKGKSYE